MIEQEIKQSEIIKHLKFNGTRSDKISNIVNKLFDSDDTVVYLAYNDKFVIIRRNDEIEVAICNRYNRRIKRPAIVKNHGKVIVQAVDIHQKADIFNLDRGVSIACSKFL